MGARPALAALAAGTMLVPPATAHAGPTDAELKAEFVERFTRFVDWAEDDLPDHEFVICVHGDTAITPYLQKIARKRKLRGRRAVVDIVIEPDDLADCQIVVIGGTDRKRLRAAISRTEGRPILTVADAPGAAEAGAIVNFFVDHNHVKFEINPRAARDSGLKLRARLLKVGKLVKAAR